MIKAGILGTIGAVIAVAIVFLIGDAVSGPFLTTPPGGDVAEEVPLGVALFSTVLGGIAGLGIAALCQRFAGNAVSAFVVVCVVGLIVSGVFSFTAGDNVATGVWLNVMHVAAAVPIVGLLVRALQTPQTP